MWMTAPSSLGVDGARVTVGVFGGASIRAGLAVNQVAGWSDDARLASSV